MRALDSPELVSLTQQLNSVRFNSYFLSAKIEAFTSSFGDFKSVSKAQKSIKSNAAIKPSSSSPSEFESVAVEQVDASSSIFGDVEKVTRRERSESIGASSVNTARKPSRRRASSLGDLSEPSSRALLSDLITALNDTFPDYDFTDSKIDRFKECGWDDAMRLLNPCLAEAVMMIPNGSIFLDSIWGAIDRVVGLKGCEVFLFNHHPDDFDNNDLSDESHGCLWEFNAFFFRASTGKLVYFTCSARSLIRDMEIFRQQSDMLVSDDDDDDNQDQGMQEEETDDEMDDDNARQVEQLQGNEEFDHEDLPDWDGII